MKNFVNGEGKEEGEGNWSEFETGSKSLIANKSFVCFRFCGQ